MSFDFLIGVFLQKLILNKLKYHLHIRVYE